MTVLVTFEDGMTRVFRNVSEIEHDEFRQIVLYRGREDVLRSKDVVTLEVLVP
jgi:hypothetical protein